MNNIKQFPHEDMWSYCYPYVKRDITREEALSIFDRDKISIELFHFRDSLPGDLVWQEKRMLFIQAPIMMIDLYVYNKNKTEGCWLGLCKDDTQEDMYFLLSPIPIEDLMNGEYKAQSVFADTYVFGYHELEFGINTFRKLSDAFHRNQHRKTSRNVIRKYRNKILNDEKLNVLVDYWIQFFGSEDDIKIYPKRKK
jgi:hypothetical protein